MSLRIQASVVACSLSAVAGVLYAAEVGFVNPNGFGVNESELIAAMVVLGGIASLLGPIVGALVLTGVTAGLTFAPIHAASLGLDEQLAYGVLLVGVMLVRPEGLLGGFSRVRARVGQRMTQQGVER